MISFTLHPEKYIGHPDDVDFVREFSQGSFVVLTKMVRQNDENGF